MLIIRPLTYNDQQWTCMHDRRTLYLAISLKVLESFFFFEWSVFPKCNILCKTLINQFLSNYDSCVLSTGRTVQWLRTKTKIHFYSFSLFIITVVMLYETVRQLLINNIPFKSGGKKGEETPPSPSWLTCFSAFRFASRVWRHRPCRFSGFRRLSASFLPARAR